MKVERISIPLGKNRITVESYNYDGEHPEIAVFLQNDDGVCLQDICLVRPHVVEPATGETTDEIVDCIVWADENSDDYTDKHVIPVYGMEDYS